MGRIAKVLDFARAVVRGAHVSDVTGDPGGGGNVTARHFGPPGEDSQPLPGDYVATERAPGSGREQVTGYADTKNQPKAAGGEVRRYARDPASGTIVGVLWLRNDGTVEVGLEPDDFAALASKVLGELEAVKADIDAVKSAFDAHTHSYNPGPGSPTTTAAPASPMPSPHTPESVASTTVKVKS